MRSNVLPVRSSVFYGRSIVMILAAALLVPSLAGANPAMNARYETVDGGVEASFRGFARSWMDRAQARGERDQARPRAHEGGATIAFLYRAVGHDYEVLLEPTGNPNAPYIGVLQYTEQTFQCRDARGADCTLAASQPVSEVFRYRGGRWSY